MTKKIFRSVFLVSLIVLLISFSLVLGVLSEYTENRSKEELKSELALAANAVALEGTDYLRTLTSGDLRVTWIAADGSVLYDTQESHPESMENHLTREEVMEALQDGYGESQRYSRTLMERYLYAAQVLDDGTILRLSVSQNSVFALVLGMFQPLAAILLAALVLSAFFAQRMSRRIVAPINDLNLEQPLDNEGYDELSPLFRKIHTQQVELSDERAHLVEKQNELNVVLGNMQEGMILLDAKARVISINDAAKKILQVADIRKGQSLTGQIRSYPLMDLIAAAQRKENAESILSLSERRYQVIAHPVIEKETQHEKGITIVLFDVTAREEAEQLRREFTANVSHELKTPLHSISGYAELLKGGLVSEKDYPAFAGKIYQQAQRMIQMVGDILTLSHLDENTDDLAFVRTDIWPIVQNAVKQLAPSAKEKEVALSVSGEETVLYANPTLIAQIVSNLCENAIKYNHPGGQVSVTAGQESGQAVLTVCDDGIGIPQADQDRVFERFYRVDKSRSRESGGTGLGLSIVKHAVRLHHGTITLNSVPDQGTTVTVRLPLGGESRPQSVETTARFPEA